MIKKYANVECVYFMCMRLCIVTSVESRRMGQRGATLGRARRPREPRKRHQPSKIQGGAAPGVRSMTWRQRAPCASLC